ncbi:MAG TPA: trehalase family glycosidase [Terracidiphilus sp.]|jgi:alpha,alpha-trehalase|nr:trehalase family glycosidase [Terracidiphilus sp.]
MKLFRLFFLAFFAVLAATIQTADLWAQKAAAPNPDATLQYIHAAWDTLTRSVTDCNSIADIKVDSAAAANPVLYLPADLSAPSKVTALEQTCHVRVIPLPRRIEKLGDVRPEELHTPGLLYLPNPYIVPGGRFNEMYGWDSYFILLGLEADHREALAKGIVDNFLFEVEHYGAVLNANRTYYLTRSQPPFLTSMIRAVIENPASFPATPAGRTQARSWLQHAYMLAEKDYTTWARPEHKAGSTGLTRYYDYGTGPVPEMADDSSYYTDVIRWLVAHPHQGGDAYLVKDSEHPDAAEAARLKLTSCDVRASVVCARAWFDGYRLSRDFYLGDRAVRESGFDTSNRFGPFSGDTHHYAPVCLNSLLYRYERDLEHLALLLSNAKDAAHWDRRSQARASAIQRYLWRPKDGVFADFDFVHARTSSYAYITSFYPLWAGYPTRDQTTKMEAKLNLFERPGGLSTSNTNTGLQWDEPFGWAPTNWIVVAGLEAFGFRADAARIAQHFDATVDAGFAADNTIREKYNVVAGNSNVQVSAGYTTNEIGFGWTNAIYLKMREIMQKQGITAAN